VKVVVVLAVRTLKQDLNRGWDTVLIKGGGVRMNNKITDQVKLCTSLKRIHLEFSCSGF
jgi:hypothetical protein